MMYDVYVIMSSSNWVHVHHLLDEQWILIFVILPELLGRWPGLLPRGREFRFVLIGSQCM